MALELYERRRPAGLDQLRCESLALRFLADALDSFAQERDGAPSAGGPVSAERLQGGAVAALAALIDASPDRQIAADEYPELFGMSERQMRRAFSSVLHVSPAEYRRVAMLRRARRALLTDSRSVKEIGYACGYGHVGNFTRAYRSEFGESPSDTRRRRRGEPDPA